MFKCRSLLLILTLSALYSCGEKNQDPQFCECLSISKQLNDKNQKLVNSTKTNEDLVVEVKNLITEKRNICKPYEQMSFEEMIVKEKECK